MSNNAPYANTIYCGYCDTEAVEGKFGGKECPDCGRGINMMLTYSGRDPETRQEVVDEHDNDE